MRRNKPWQLEHIYTSISHSWFLEMWRNILSLKQMLLQIDQHFNLKPSDG